MLALLTSSTALERVHAMDKELEDSVMAAVLQCVQVRQAWTLTPIKPEP